MKSGGGLQVARLVNADMDDSGDSGEADMVLIRGLSTAPGSFVNWGKLGIVDKECLAWCASA
jgi:hypothetical protein